MKKIPFMLLSVVVSITMVASPAYAADEPGWQLAHTDSWYVDGHTVTEPRSMYGGGVKVCFSEQAYSYEVRLWENDSVNPDESFSWKSISSASGSCATWSDINTEAGKEELYLEIKKNNSVVDLIVVKMYD